jgi:hypothetical protein
MNSIDVDSLCLDKLTLSFDDNSMEETLSELEMDDMLLTWITLREKRTGLKSFRENLFKLRMIKWALAGHLPSKGIPKLPFQIAQLGEKWDARITFDKTKQVGLEEEKCIQKLDERIEKMLDEMDEFYQKQIVAITKKRKRTEVETKIFEENKEIVQLEERIETYRKSRKGILT